MPTGPVVRRLVKEPSVADLLRSAECPAGVEPACPVWRTDAWAARPRAHGSAEGEGVEPSRLVARPGSGRVPSPVGLPFRPSVWMAGFEPAWSGTRGRRMMPGSPTSRTIRLLPRPTKKARGHATPGLEGPRPEKGRVSLSQRVDGQRRGQGLALGRCRRPLSTEVRVTACHHALYFVRRRPRFCRRRSALASRTSSRRDKAPGGSPIRADFLKGAGRIRSASGSARRSARCDTNRPVLPGR